MGPRSMEKIIACAFRNARIFALDVGRRLCEGGMLDRMCYVRKKKMIEDYVLWEGLEDIPLSEALTDTSITKRVGDGLPKRLSWRVDH